LVDRPPAPTNPRLRPPEREHLAADLVALLDLTAPAGGAPAPTIAVLAHQPALLAPFLSWAAALALEGALPKREHELLALRTAHLCRSAFEWDEHVGYARAAGMANETIARVRGGPDEPGWAAHETALVRAADQLHSDCAVDEPTWKALAAHFGPAALVEIPYVVGQYTMLSMVANMLGLDPEATPEGG
jgi:4-carboxymuconolactone decarboxylase